MSSSCGLKGTAGLSGDSSLHIPSQSPRLTCWAPPQLPSCPLEQMHAFHICLRPGLQHLAASAITTQGLALLPWRACPVAASQAPFFLLQTLRYPVGELAGTVFAEQARESVFSSARRGPCHNSAPPAERQHHRQCVNRPRGCVPTKLLVWTLKPEFISFSHVTSLLFFVP